MEITHSLFYMMKIPRISQLKNQGTMTKNEMEASEGNNKIGRTVIENSEKTVLIIIEVSI